MLIRLSVKEIIEATLKHESPYRSIRKDNFESLKLYVDHGIEPGGFLLAVLANDLMGAFGKG